MQHKLHESDLDVWELVQLTCTLCCETTIKLIKDRKLLLLFPQFIKYKTFELLWNLDITQGSHYLKKCPNPFWQAIWNFIVLVSKDAKFDQQIEKLTSDIFLMCVSKYHHSFINHRGFRHPVILSIILLSLLITRLIFSVKNNTLWVHFLS